MFTLEFETDNAAFQGDSVITETARILREVAQLIEAAGHTVGVVRDINGNRVGRFTLEA